MGDEVLRVRLTADGIQEVMNALKKVEGQTLKNVKAANESRDALGSLGTLFAAQQIAAFAANALTAADQLGKLSQKTGIAVEELSVYSYMAQQADVSQEDLGKGFAKLSKSMDALHKGDATTSDAFKRIGLSAQDLAGLGLDQIFLKVANAQEGYADGAGKAAVMMALFGKSGASLIPLMNDLAKGGFENAKKKLQDLGLVLSADTARAAQDFNDSMKRLEMAAQGVTVQVAGSMLPGITAGIDGLVKILSGTPAAAKAFSVSFLLVGTAATAAAVGIRAVGTALVGLGPVGIAVVAISALVSGLMALEAANERARQDELKSIANKGTMVQQGEALEKAYRKEAAALEKSGDNKKEAGKHALALKTIEDQLISLSPELQNALKNETKDWREKAEAIKAAREQAQESLKIDKLKTEQAIADQIASLQASRRIFKEQRDIMGTPKGAKPVPEISEADLLNDPVLKELHAKRKRINQALGLEAPDAAPGGDGKKDLTAQNDALIKAQAASLAAAAKRGAEGQKQALDEFSALNEEFYKHGLISLETYLSARETIIKAQADQEIALIQTQIAAEEATRATIKTPAERLASDQKIADLGAQIKAKQTDAEQKLQALERTGNDLRHTATLDAIKLEGELEQAKGKTGTAAIRAIEAEYAERIRLATSPEAKAAQAGLRDVAIGKAKNEEAGRMAGRAQTGLDMSLTGIDQQREAGLISEAQAVDKRTQAYEKWLPIIRAAALLQLEAAKAVGDPALVQSAEKQLQEIDGMAIKLANMKDQLKDFKDAARDAFIDGFANFLETLTDKTSSLTDKIKALGASIAQAVLKMAAMKLATSAAGAMGFAGGGPIYGPGTSTSDSIPIWASDGEFMLRAAAVKHYGLGTIDAINGIRLPKGLVRGYAEGGAIGAPTMSPIPVRGDFSHSMQIGLDEGLILRAMDSPEGARITLKHASAHSKKFNSALGRKF